MYLNLYLSAHSGTKKGTSSIMKKVWSSGYRRLGFES